jgi:hypothetical protein
MNTLTPAAKKPLRSLVPIKSFVYENFEVPVVACHKPLAIGAAFRRLNMHQSKTILTSIDAARPGEIFPPSPSLPGHGLMCLPFGARPVVRPAAPSSRRLRVSASIPQAAQEPEPIPSEFHKMK